MFKNILIFYILLFCFDSVAQECNTYIDPYYWTIDVESYIHINSEADVTSLRTYLINRVWKDGNGIPAGFPDDYEFGLPESEILVLTGFTNLESKDKFTIDMGLGFTNYVLYVRPIQKNGKLFIVHEGHESIGELGVYETIQSLLNEGYAVLYCLMPQKWPNIAPPEASFHYYPTFETPTFNPLKFFVEPIAKSLNFLIYYYGYTDVSMIGISGGGWTTTIYAAMDTRIQRSIPVAGSLPDYLRTGPCRLGDNDWEQNSLEVPGIISYLDLYILGATGEGRSQLQVLNQFESCCFGGINYQTYENIVKDKVNCLKTGKYEVLLDATHTEHMISPYARDYIINTPPCPSNATFSYSIDDYTSGFLDIKTSDNITASNKLTDKSRVLLDAKNSIIMLPGFEVNQNSCGSFVAKMGGCN